MRKKIYCAVPSSRSVSAIKSSAGNIDLSGAVRRGQECINALRSVLPDIPSRCPYRRYHTWSNTWRVVFDLGVDVSDLAEDYFDTNYDQDGSARKIMKDAQDALWDDNVVVDEAKYQEAVDSYTNAYWGYIETISNKCDTICKEFSDDDYHCAFSYFNNETDKRIPPRHATLSVYDKSYVNR